MKLSDLLKMNDEEKNKMYNEVNGLYYKLDENKKVIPCSMREWVDFRRDADNKIIRHQTVNGKFISTVFVGLDHNWDDEDDELHIFETMVFPSKEDMQDEYCDRCGAYEDALKMHDEAVKWVKDGCKEDNNATKNK